MNKVTVEDVLAVEHKDPTTHEITHEGEGIKQFLVSDGKRGSIPQWYMNMAIARFLNMKPWELDKVERIWIERALDVAESMGWFEFVRMTMLKNR